MKSCSEYKGPFCGQYICCPISLDGGITYKDIVPGACKRCNCNRGCANCKVPEENGKPAILCQLEHNLFCV